MSSGSENNPCLSVQGLCKHFARRAVLNDISFSVQSGEILLVSGQNGAGKSTLLSCLSGLMRPNAGTINIGAFCITKRKDYSLYLRESAAGVLAEDSFFYSALSLKENLLLSARLFSLLEPEARLHELAGVLNLSDNLDLKPPECSTGTIRRAALLRAFLNRPRLLILDEPLNALDHQGRGSVRSLLIEAQKSGAAAVVATHDFSFVEGVDHRVLNLKNGTIDNTEVKT